MGTVRNTFAVVLAGLALAAFMPETQAQSRGRERTSVTKPAPDNSRTVSSRRSGTPERRSAVSATQQGNRRVTSGQTTKPSTPVARPSSGQFTKPSGQNNRPTQVAKPSGQQKPSSDFRPGNQDRPVQVTRPGTRPSKPAASPSVRPDNGKDKRPAQRPGNGQGVGPDRKPEGRPDKAGKGPGNPGHRPAPVQVRPGDRPRESRVHPRERDYMRYDRPARFWTREPHCYGHRVRVLPSDVIRHIFRGVTYYCCNDIWYRPYGGHYVVCRPPFGTSLAADLIADMTWAAVNMAYYSTVANTYSQINENNRYIAEQNAIIAQNNALIAAQNASIASGQQAASQAYSLANSLGLVQSYAAAGSTYYYQDGVFYTLDADGTYVVIVPPAGALVETLPEDYDMVTLGGQEYYKVDDTVYMVTISDGKPYFEVLGQM